MMKCMDIMRAWKLRCGHLICCFTRLNRGPAGTARSLSYEIDAQIQHASDSATEADMIAPASALSSEAMGQTHRCAAAR